MWDSRLLWGSTGVGSSIRTFYLLRILTTDCLACEGACMGDCECWSVTLERYAEALRWGVTLGMKIKLSARRYKERCQNFGFDCAC